MFGKVKLALRLRNAAFDDEVTALIAAAKADLRLLGITFTDPPGENAPAGDPLIERAIILYCKAHFGYIAESERFSQAYDSLKMRLRLAGDKNALE